ncbi:uroporphyrinogen decarboxylase family protein [Vallitalea sediminicola]
MSYTSFERIKRTLEHKEPDRIPFDIGGSVLTGMNKVCYFNLRDYLKMPHKEIDILDEMQQLARIDEDMNKRLKVDVRCVDPLPPTKIGLYKAPVIDGKYYKRVDEWGIEWKMPMNQGLYYDMVKGSLTDSNSITDIDSFPWPDPIDEGRFKNMKEKADKYVYEDKKAYILGRQYAGIWETALWMSGYEKFFIDMAINEKYAHSLMNKITELKMQYWERALEEVGENVLIVSEADDLATQNSLLCSVDMYKRLVHPYHKKLFEFIKKKAKKKVYIFYHTCGACKPLIPYLIDEGVDILNPVQVNASDMDTKVLKREFGKDITFWGGGVDTQQVLPFGTPEQVRDEVKKRIEDLAKDGGFVFSAVHNVQGDVPPENFMAMWETLQEYGKY